MCVNIFIIFSSKICLSKFVPKIAPNYVDFFKARVIFLIVHSKFFNTEVLC